MINVWEKLVFLDTSSVSLAEEHLAKEKKLMNASILFMLLRKGWYAENFRATLMAFWHDVLLITAQIKEKTIRCPAQLFPYDIKKMLLE